MVPQLRFLKERTELKLKNSTHVELGDTLFLNYNICYDALLYWIRD